MFVVSGKDTFKVKVVLKKPQVAVLPERDSMLDKYITEMGDVWLDSKIADSTYSSYINSLCALYSVIREKFADCGNFLNCMNFQSADLITALESHPSRMNCIRSVLCLFKHSKLFQSEFTNIHLWRVAGGADEQRSAMDERLEGKYEINGVPIYSKIHNNLVLDDVWMNDRYNHKKFIRSLYCLLPPARDDYALIRLVKTSSDMDIDMTECNGYYIIDSGEIILNKYKTSETYGTIRYSVPLRLKSIIDSSLRIKPRKWLVCMEKNDTVYSGGHLSKIITDAFGKKLSINDIRHSFENFMHSNFAHFTKAEIVAYNKYMGHSLAQSIQYTIGGSAVMNVQEIVNSTVGTAPIVSNLISGNILDDMFNKITNICKNL